VAVFASPVAVLFAGAFACAEYASVRRHRRRSLRLRTAATTALVFGAGAWLPVALRAPRSAVAGGAALAAADGARERVLALASELGRVAAAPERLGIPGALLAGAIVLVALAPVLRAARHAPRLWSWILAAWAAALAASLAWASSSATEWSSPRGLLAASVWSAGLGLALGTLARPWRAVVVALVACAWAVLAHASARPWAEGTRVLASFRGELAAQALPEGTHVLVLDPPGVDGLPPFSRALGWLLRERRDQDADAPRFDPRALQGLTSAAFLVLSRSPAFERLRASGVVVLVPRRAVGEERGGWQPVALAAARAKAPLLKPWRGGLTHVFDDPIDPFEVEEVRVAADLVVAPRELAELGWRTVAGGSGTAPAFLCEQGGRRVADFDLAGSLAWRLADPVRRLIVEKGERDVEGVEFLARSRELPGQGPPEVAGADWCFARPALAGEERGGSLVLAMLALDELELIELPLEPASSDPAGVLCARGAQRYAARASARGATLAWELEYRIGPHALYRTRGIVP